MERLILRPGMSCPPSRLTSLKWRLRSKNKRASLSPPTCSMSRGSLMNRCISRTKSREGSNEDVVSSKTPCFWPPLSQSRSPNASWCSGGTVYRLAEHLLRRQLASTSQTVPNQINQPTDRPTMRWIFQCFEGIDLLHIRVGLREHLQVLGLQPLPQKILRLLGSAYCQFYFFSP